MLGPVGLFILWAVLATVWTGLALVAALLIKLCSSEVQMTTQRIPAAEGSPARTIHGFYRWWGNLAGIGVGVLTVLFGLLFGWRVAEWLLYEVGAHWRGLLLAGLLLAGIVVGLVHARKLDRRKFCRFPAARSSSSEPSKARSVPPSPPSVVVAPAARYRPTEEDLAAVPPAPVTGWTLDPGAPHWASRPR
jgi:hypothetical protein